jgi:hypothetical protein
MNFEVKFLVYLDVALKENISSMCQGELKKQPYLIFMLMTNAFLVLQNIFVITCLDRQLSGR